MARKPWCCVLYWFAMLIDAERIDREVGEIDDLRRTQMHAVGFHDPERLGAALRDALDALEQQTPSHTEEELIAYALQRQAERKAEELVS